VDGGKKADTEAIMRGSGRKLTTIASTADEFNFFGFDTSINGAGEVAFKAELDEGLDFVEGLFSGRGTKAGVTTHYLSSTSPFDGDDSRPAINDAGDIAFHATLDDGTSGIFLGPDAVADRAVATGDTLDGATVQNITFCEQGLSDAGEFAFMATLEDVDAPDGFRFAVFRATLAV
jgi:hypothetical protein